MCASLQVLLKVYIINICSMLHLSGYAVTMEDLKQFRQIDSITPGHPENFATPGDFSMLLI